MNTSKTILPTGITVVGERTEMPRPLRKLPDLPDPAVIKAVRAAAKKRLQMSDKAAGAMSTMWVHPDQVLPQIDEPRRMRIPGGDLLYIEGLVWTARLMADPGNPRNAAEYHYPLAGPASKGESEFVHTEIGAKVAELTMSAPSRESLVEALTVAMEKTRVNNTPYPPIGDQGIMDAPFGVMTVLQFAGGEPEVAVPHVREGSTRTSHAHEILGLDPEDTLFVLPSSAKPMQAFIDRLNELIAKPATELSDHDRALIRCATTNFILIVGFEEDFPKTMDLAEAIKVKVAQEHLNTKLDWSGPAQNSVLADDCLAAAFDSGLLADAHEYQWLLGRLTRADAAAAGYGTHADDRFARIGWLFTSKDKDVHDVIRRPIAFVLRKDPGRKSFSVQKTSKIPLAAELMVREVRGQERYQGPVVNQITKVLVNGASLATKTGWTPGTLSLKALEKAAFKEITTGVPGPAGTELAMRALYYGALHDTLRVPRNDQGAQSDRRSVADLLEDMLGSVRGVKQLRAIVEEGRHGKAAVLRDEEGEPVPGGDGQPVLLTNYVLRYNLFPKGGKSTEEEGTDPFVAAQGEVTKILKELKHAVSVLEAEKDDEGVSIVDQQGLPSALVKGWRRTVDDVRRKLEDWFETGVEYSAGMAQPPTTEAGEDDEDDVTEHGAA